MSMCAGLGRKIAKAHEHDLSGCSAFLARPLGQSATPAHDHGYTSGAATPYSSFNNLNTCPPVPSSAVQRTV